MMALTREELKMWADTNPSEKEWRYIRVMSHLDAEEKEEDARDSIRRLAERDT